MRSATSYCNGALYRKTMARFWPLWVAYGVIWLFCIPLNLLNYHMSRDHSWSGFLYRALDLPEMAMFGLYLAALFAILCAMAVFGYLYNSRSACWFHALPLRREALFATQYLAGLSFLLLPQLATAVLTAMIEMAFLPMEQWGAALSALLAWLLAQSGVCLFFFSFAAFCAMFTGHILALPAFYGILNFLATVIYSLLEALMTEFFYGYNGTPGAEEVVKYLTPAHALREAVVVHGRGDFGGYYYDSPATVAAYAVVGVLLAVASLEVYRRRHAETAGDVVAIPVVRPLFKYGVSFCSGLCLGMFTTMFFGWIDTMTVLIPCVLVWAVIGYFAAEMLLKKSFRVLKAWKGAAAMAAALLLLCLACRLDLFGVVGRVPNADRVEKLTVSMRTGYPDDSGSYLSDVFTDPEQIQKFLALHQAVVDDRDRDSNGVLRHYKENDDGTWYAQDYTSLRLSYTLKGGGTLTRYYRSIPLYQEELDREGSVTCQARQICEDRELVAQAYGFDSFLEDARVTSAWLSAVKLADNNNTYASVAVDDYARELWDAVQADFAEGTIGVRYLFDSDPERAANTYMTDLNFGATDNRVDRPYSGNPANYDLKITLTPQARHTLAALDRTGIFEEGYSLAPHDSSKYENTIEYPPLTSW